MDALRQQIEDNLKERAQEESENEYNTSIIDKMLEDAEIKFPPQLLDHELDHYVQDFSRNLSAQGMDLDTFLKSRDMEMEAFREEARPSTEERLRRSLVLMETSVAEKIKIKPEEVDELVQERINQLAQYLTPEQAKQYFTPETVQNMVASIINEETADRTLARLRAIARGEEIPVEDETEVEEAETVEAEAEASEPEPEASASAEEAEESETVEAEAEAAEEPETAEPEEPTAEETDSTAGSEDSTALEEDVAETEES